MEKKGQITIFIIIAIVIVVGLILYLSVRGGLITQQVSPAIKPIHSFVDNCVSKVGEDAIYHIGETGGYFLYSKRSNEVGIAYYFDKGENLFPSKEKIQDELSLYMNEMLFFCVQNFIEFPDFEINQKEIKTETRIVKDKVIFNVNYPLTILKDDKSYFLKNFKKEIPTRLNTIFEVASGIIEEQMLDFENICINCIGDLAFDNKIYVTFNDDPFDEETMIFSIIDDEYKINGEDYFFYFANRYNIK